MDHQQPTLNNSKAIADLITTAGLDENFSLHRLVGGANNRVFRVEANGYNALLKIYFQHPSDPRDRGGTEFAFSHFAWENGLRCLPKPLAYDSSSHIGLYQFVEGRQLLPHEVTEKMVQQALDFWGELNRHRQLPTACALPKASEACFTISAHLQCVERRLSNLRGAEQSTAIHREAVHFIENELLAVWNRTVNDVRRRVRKLEMLSEVEILPQDRCLSPSDFGFHNAIHAADGQLRFIDFEYAGWDDPAKMVCDFFCQPAVSVSLGYYDMFVEGVVSALSEPTVHYERMAILLPVYQVKWCCILLNDFLPIGNKRRRFAHGGTGSEERKLKQLQKARHMLHANSL